jgi:transaldolase
MGRDLAAAYPAARQVFADLADLGVDFNDVTDTLEREGVQKFSASWGELRTSVDKQLKVVSNS